jgi:hypothetical protein
MGLLSSLLRLSAVVALAVAGLWAPPAPAAMFADLYTVTVTPEATLGAEPDAAVQAAMTRLLIRVTGSRNAPLDPALQPLINSPRSFLSSSGSDRQGRALFGFSPIQVERALTELGQPTWGPERPLTLLWSPSTTGQAAAHCLGPARRRSSACRRRPQ